MLKITDLTYNELRTEASKLDITLKNPTKDTLIAAIKAKLNLVDQKEKPKAPRRLKPVVEVQTELPLAEAAPQETSTDTVAVGTLIGKGVVVRYPSGKVDCTIVGDMPEHVMMQKVGSTRVWKESKSQAVVVVS